MYVCRVEGLSKEYGTKPVFSEISFEIHEGEKIVLFGQNGIGKTTLIEILLKSVPVDSGRVSYGVPLSQWGWLEQHPKIDENLTLLEVVRSGDSLLYKLHQRLREVEQRLSECSDLTSHTATESLDLAHEYSHLLDEYHHAGGYEWEIRIESCLRRLNLSESSWALPFSALSGGQKTRAQIARLLVRQPRVLVLDEPTNHLDADKLSWLESWVRSYDGTVITVTHDRHYMDAVADAILELTRSGCTRYSGGYTEFRQQKDLEIQTQQALYEKQQRQRRDLTRAIQQYREWYQKAHDAAGERNPFLKKRAMKNSTRLKSKEKALEHLEAQMVARPSDAEKTRFELTDNAFEGKTLLRARDVRVEFETTTVLTSMSLDISRGDRLAVLGRNGAGKSTLLRVLTGDLLPTTGEVQHHPQLTIGYFDQELQQLEDSQTILDTILEIPGMTQSYARTVLAGFLFKEDDVCKRISDLSMGERCRVAFVQLYFSKANLLVLDEPTNYLDVDTREHIEQVLLEYPGALMIVSHDRYLVSKVANRIALVENGSVGTFDGTYQEYVERLANPSGATAVENEIRQLELLLAQWMGSDVPEDESGQMRLLQNIRDARQRLNELRLSRGM